MGVAILPKFRVFSMGVILVTTQSTQLAKTQQVMGTKNCTTTGKFSIPPVHLPLVELY